MSRFFSGKYRDLVPYTPGEQPKGQQLIKLNTNESPFPPADDVAEAVKEEAAKLNLYNDPECTALRECVAARYNVSPDEVIMTNGSDEVLNFAFMAFCDDEHPAVFPDITYGFYPVFAKINRVPYKVIPLKEDWTIAREDYAGEHGMIVIANPNAPTGLALSLDEIEKLLMEHSDDLIVVDEAYVDFGAESAVRLVREYNNLLVTRTFSKSRSLAGLRLGFGIAQKEIIRDLKTMQYSTNPYNVDRLAQAAGIASLMTDDVNLARVQTVCETREWTRAELEKLGFEMTDSRANFLFARHAQFPGSLLRDGLRERGILIRWFDQERIRDWSRITIGKRENMETMVNTIARMLEEKK